MPMWPREDLDSSCSGSKSGSMDTSTQLYQLKLQVADLLERVRVLEKNGVESRIVETTDEAREHEYECQKGILLNDDKYCENPEDC